ncbi:MAG: 50S ribosomal protein L22 [Acidobacteria bacterium]|nr:50S ribosomal protein L22 [Acidobacteriota bacterium]
MQATAKMRYIRLSPQKARLVVDQIRGRKVEEALMILRVTNKRAAPQIAKVLRSAMANAENNGEADVDQLFVKEVFVNDGPRLKRLRPAPMGRAYRYVHHLAHIVVTVSDGQEEVAKEPTQE